MSRGQITRLRWQSSKRVVRAGVLLAMVYVSAVVTVVFQLPLWLWLTVESILRYVPFWLSIPFLLYVGWQLDTVLSLPLGTGLGFLLLMFVSLMVLRSPRLPVLQGLWRVVGFSIFAVIMNIWWWQADWRWILVQSFLYTVLLMANLYRRHKE